MPGASSYMRKRLSQSLSFSLWMTRRAVSTRSYRYCTRAPVGMSAPSGMSHTYVPLGHKDASPVWTMHQGHYEQALVLRSSMTYLQGECSCTGTEEEGWRRIFNGGRVLVLNTPPAMSFQLSESSKIPTPP